MFARAHHSRRFSINGAPNSVLPSTRDIGVLAVDTFKGGSGVLTGRLAPHPAGKMWQAGSGAIPVLTGTKLQGPSSGTFCDPFLILPHTPVSVFTRAHWAGSTVGNGASVGCFLRGNNSSGHYFIARLIRNFEFGGAGAYTARLEEWTGSSTTQRGNASIILVNGLKSFETFVELLDSGSRLIANFGHFPNANSPTQVSRLSYDSTNYTSTSDNAAGIYMQDSGTTLNQLFVTEFFARSSFRGFDV